MCSARSRGEQGNRVLAASGATVALAPARSHHTTVLQSTLGARKCRVDLWTGDRGRLQNSRGKFFSFRSTCFDVSPWNVRKKKDFPINRYISVKRLEILWN
ncbi:unnamed protein product [Hermetia illucens]|uniref:Uncharacterized protein n=1 Tax=Hermetia illucens TaxID=343691 RepID=A0A7R8UHU1_HERIL|nr:unnamed protein product [Hermetia illucens]